MRPRVRLPHVHFISVTSYPEVDIRDALEVFTQLADHNLSLHENAGQKSTQNLDTVPFLTVFGCFRPSFRLQYIELVVSLVPRLRQWRKEGKQVKATDYQNANRETWRNESHGYLHFDAYTAVYCIGPGFGLA